MTILTTMLLAPTEIHFHGHIPSYLWMAFMMVVFGIIIFYVAFKQFREARILADVPKAHVRSMSMGLVHLHGKATGEALTSPLTGARCFMFLANIAEWVKTTSRSGGTTWGWRTMAGDDDFKEFYLDDGTGRVLVKPPGAQSGNLQRTFDCEIDKDGHFKSVHPSPGIPAPTEQAVWAWIHGAHSRKLMDKNLELEAASMGQDPEKAKEFMLKFLNVQRQIGSLGAAPRVESLGAALEGTSASGLRGGPYRVTEDCFLADSDCFILGTCAENPEAKSSEDRHMIHEGRNEKTFMLSTQGEVKVEKSLRLQTVGLFFFSVALIVGAFALAIYGG
jgi:hypothetical protein